MANRKYLVNDQLAVIAFTELELEALKLVVNEVCHHPDALEAVADGTSNRAAIIKAAKRAQEKLYKPLGTIG